MFRLLTPLILFTFPVLVFAQGIVPCNPKTVDGKLVDNCGFCQVGQLITNTFDWFVMIAGIFVVLVIIVAGLILGASVGNVSAMATARKSIATAVIGYIILLASWMIVDTFVKFLIPGSSYGVHNELMCN